MHKVENQFFTSVVGKGGFHLGIRVQIIAVLTLAILLSVGIPAINTSLSFYRSNLSLLGARLVNQSEAAVEGAADVVMRSVTSLETLALSPSLIEAISAANQMYSGRAADELSSEIARLDQAWKDEDPNVEPLVTEIASNPISAYLLEFQSEFPEEVEVFVTDIQGLNVAMTDRTGDYLQADEGWWQAAYANGAGAISISDVEFDDSTGVWALNIGVPIRAAGSQEVIGILRGTADVSVVFMEVAAIQIGETGSAILLDRENNILYAAEEEWAMQPAPETIVTLINSEDLTWGQNIPDLTKHAAIMAYSRLEGDLADTLGWTLLLHQDMAEILAPVWASVVQSLLITGLVALVLILFGLWFARSLINPIQMVAIGAHRLATGDAELSGMDWEAFQKVSTRRDELGMIGRAFDELIGYFKEMAQAAQAIASGDLTVHVDSHGDQDTLGQAFTHMVVNLRELVWEVSDNANNLGAASGQLAAAANQAGQATSQIAATVQQVAKGTSQQSESVSLTANSVDQLGRAIDGVARGAQEQATAVQQAADLTTQISSAIQQVSAAAQNVSKKSTAAADIAHDGAETVQQAVAGIQTINDYVSQSAAKVAEMGQRSQQISTIVETIEDIAAQTNLLALNAAIEAARAGEHGKGFAVVADEVRKLAERSAHATREIGDLVKGIQVSVKEAVEAMQLSTQQAKAGATFAQNAGESLTSILQATQAVFGQAEQAAAAAQQMNAAADRLVGAMDTVSAVVEENTAATEEMSAASFEVAQSIESIAAVSEENAAAIQEVSASSEEMTAQVEEVTASTNSLAEMAEVLRSLVARFVVVENSMVSCTPDNTKGIKSERYSISMERGHFNR